MRATVVAVVFPFVLIASPARADDAADAEQVKLSCIATHEAGQASLARHRPHAAREEFLKCARPTCPGAIQRECAEQLSVADAAAPTVSLEARGEGGNDEGRVRVFLDGVLLVDRLDGAAIPVEPGEHTFAFERPSGGTETVHVVVSEGDKNRKVVATFRPPVAAPPASPVHLPGHEAPPPSIPTMSYVLGGVSLAALGAFGVFALTGKGKENDLAGSCSPRCAEADVSAVRQDYVLADVSLGVGVVAAAAAVVLALPAITGARSSRARAQPQPLWPVVGRDGLPRWGRAGR